MKKLRCFLLIVIVCAVLPLGAYAQDTLVPVGKAVGLVLEGSTLTISAFDPLLGKPAQEAGIRPGDELLQIDSTPVSTPEEIGAALRNCGNEILLTIRRGGQVKAFRLTPVETPQGKKLGIFLRRGIAGIGTVTWYNPESGEFAALGHGISTPAGALAPFSGGSAYPARILSVQQGHAGFPGQLKGTAESQAPLGVLTRNTPQGVYGKAERPFSGEALPVGTPQPGKATILTTLKGNEPESYCVEILKIYAGNRRDGRNLLVKVTDPALLKETGGIVQGMSGSPILQDGCIVGAVTHVLVSNPAVGYGISIQNMLSAAG